MRTTLTTFAGAALASLLVLSAAAQELPFTHYTPDNQVNPLPSADIRTVHQDRLGYVWVAVYSSGLLRYNGHSFTAFGVDDGLRDLTPREIVEDSAGRLWVGSDAGLSVSEKPLPDYAVNERVRFAHKAGTIEFVASAIFLNRLCVDARGTLWTGTRENGIIRYHMVDRDSVVCDTISTALAGESKNRDIRSLCRRRDGSIWAGVGGGWILAFRDSSKQGVALPPSSGFLRSNTEVMMETSWGTLVGGCRDGSIWDLDESAAPVVRVLDRELKNPVYSVVETADHGLLAGSDGAGILRAGYRPGSLMRRRTITAANGLLGNNVSDLMLDREGNVWIAQIGGISRLRSNYGAFESFGAETRYGDNPVLPNPGINAVLTLPEFLGAPALCLGTSGGGIVIMRRDSLSASLQSADGLKNNWVNGLASDSGGRLWIGTSQGINCLSPGLPVPRTADAPRHVDLFGRRALLYGYFNASIYSCRKLPLILNEGEGTTIESIWFPGYQVIYCVAGGTMFELRPPEGLPATFFHDLVSDREGRIIVGTRDRGVFRSTEPITLKMLRTWDAWSRTAPSARGHGTPGAGQTAWFEKLWDKSVGAPTNETQSILLRGDTLYVGTPDGLAVILLRQPASSTMITTEQGLRANNTGSLAFSDFSGTIWAGTNFGLAEIEPATGKVKRTVTKENGLVDNEVWFFSSVAVGAGGTVYFGTSKGLSLYHPWEDLPNPLPPVLRFESIVRTESADGNNEIDVEYSALSFSDEQRVRFKTRLTGYDRDWSPEKSDVKIRYTNLPAFLTEKEYTFELLAGNNDGTWTELPLQYRFGVQPPWWFRWWWLASNAILLVLAVFFTNHRRIRKLQERSRELERIVDERTQKVRKQAGELEVKNTELGEKNREILRTQQQLIMQEKLASLGALTAGIAHEIKNPLNFVNNFAELSVELTDELSAELAKHSGRLDASTASYLDEILRDLKQNAVKINDHGKRADGIVRGMLLHSQGQTGERVPTDINALLEEYTGLAYHGLKAQQPDSQVVVKTDFDPAVGTLAVIPQDLSRVIINMVNNACYAVGEKKLTAPPAYVPAVTVSSRKLGDRIEIRIRDNGTGMPAQVAARIFEPFYTTKPTGKGTGLGLSLSYDIITKVHNGTISVESTEGEYTEFVITLPAAQ